MFMALTETHLDLNTNEAEVDIEKYTLYQTDRAGRSHDGVAIYVRKDFAFTTEVLHSNSNGTNEILLIL